MYDVQRVGMTLFQKENITMKFLTYYAKCCCMCKISLKKWCILEELKLLLGNSWNLLKLLRNLKCFNSVR